MAVEAFGVGNFNTAQDQFSSCDQRVNVVADANVNHTKLKGKKEKGKRKFSF